MHPSGTPKSRAEIERDILRALCSGSAANTVWGRWMSRLSAYSWVDAEHQVVYDALSRLLTGDPRRRREQLPAQATRMGFPDVDWHNYVALRPEAGPDVGALIEMLEKAGSV